MKSGTVTKLIQLRVDPTPAVHCGGCALRVEDIHPYGRTNTIPPLECTISPWPCSSRGEGIIPGSAPDVRSVNDLVSLTPGVSIVSI